MMIAERLKAGIAGDPDFDSFDVPIEAEGIGEPGALFHVSVEGRTYRVRVIPSPRGV
jgi:hypothetical protein